MAGRNNFNIVIDIDKFLSGKVASDRSDIPDFGGCVERGVASGTKDFGEQLVLKLIENIDKYGLSDSLLVGQIKMEKIEEGIILGIPESSSDGGYAMFVEYGTGIVGKSDGKVHPWAGKTGWIYDSNNHGREGWWYPSNDRDKNKHKHQDANGKWWAWTQGQVSRPFMYDTWMWARQSYSNTINSHIKREFAKMERKFK